MRGLSPYPGAWTTLVAEGEKDLTMKVFRTSKTDIRLQLPQERDVAPGRFIVDETHLYITTADTLLEILELQISGKRRMSARDFLNGFKKIATYRATNH